MDSDRRPALPLLMFRDLDEDGRKEILFSINTSDERHAGILHCLTDTGKRLWSFAVGQAATFGTTEYSAEYRINGMEVADLDHDGDFEIAVIATNVSLFPTRLLILDHDGRLIGHYWHSGHLIDLLFHDITGDGLPEMLAVGVNNEYRRGCLAVFDPLNLSGCSPQTLEYYTLKGNEPGSQLHYLLLDCSDFEKAISPTGNPICRVEYSKGDLIEIETLDAGFIYYFDFSLIPRSVISSHFTESRYREAKNMGVSISPPDENLLLRLKAGIRYWHGDAWIDGTGTSRD